MIPRGDWRLTLKDPSGAVVRSEAIEHPDKVDKDQPQRLFDRRFFYVGTSEGEMVFAEKERSAGKPLVVQATEEATEGRPAELARLLLMIAAGEYILTDSERREIRELSRAT